MDDLLDNEKGISGSKKLKVWLLIAAYYCCWGFIAICMWLIQSQIYIIWRLSELSSHLITVFTTWKSRRRRPITSLACMERYLFTLSRMLAWALLPGIALPNCRNRIIRSSSRLSRTTRTMRIWSICSTSRISLQGSCLRCPRSISSSWCLTGITNPWSSSRTIQR